MSNAANDTPVFGEEYEHEPVPQKARRSTFSVSMVWLGFPMIITGAMTGSILVAGWGKVLSYAGTKPEVPMAFGIGLTIVITLFIDAGTVTADFNRWAADTRSSLIATACAFPFANLVAMLVGGIMTAAIGLADPQPFGLDNMFGYLLNQKQGWLSVLAFVFLFCNLGSVCAHCLYNSAVGWSRIGNGRMRVFAVMLAVIGIAIAAFIAWAPARIDFTMLW